MSSAIHEVHFPVVLCFVAPVLPSRIAPALCHGHSAWLGSVVTQNGCSAPLWVRGAACVF